MFVQHKKLTYLNLPYTRLRRLYSSTVDVQVALQDFPAQMASAHLAALTSSKGIQLLLGLYLVDSCRSVFFLPQEGEVASDKAENLFQEGLEFAESIGFVLADADINQLRPDQLDAYWRKLPICRKPVESATADNKAAEGIKLPLPAEEKVPAPVKKVAPQPSISLEERRKRCKESLGRFLASL